MPPPVCFTITATLPQPPEELAAGILVLESWPRFKGWGPLPGIREARFVRETDGVVGTVIACTNTDGSTHTEEILEWDPSRRLVLRLAGFSRPLRFIASEFIESWDFGDGRPTPVTRRFELHPRAALTRPLLYLIRPLLRRAILAQLAQLASETPD